MAVDYSLFGGAESLSEGRKPASDASNQGRSPRRVYAAGEGERPDLHAHQKPPMDPKDFLWLMTEEPHRSRRMAIMKAHPEVTKLMGHDTLDKWVVLGVVSLQIFPGRITSAILPHSPCGSSSPAYAVGGTANHNLFLAIHEITHNLAYLAIFANLPIGIPYSAAFKGYHIEHHKFQGVDGIDTDLPTKVELMFLNNVLGKVFFATFQILFYALRPTFVRVQKFTQWHALNVLVQLVFDYILVQTCGWRPLIYLIMSSFFAGSLHPCAGHFIAEHYLWDATTAPLNVLAYNVGYHNEHHDFPSVPWTRLPALRAMAPEFLRQHPQPIHRGRWSSSNFIRDKEVGIYARAKRLAKGAKTCT
ncbi:dihydroceramide delta(4)-desaturase [Coprinopsis sp. MPI-PUGE-AT-0042]|nr:dihydroceramide delta(4)-desaturase [Coprinopsis sp. MPI-PUGE-AT-0042]